MERAMSRASGASGSLSARRHPSVLASPDAACASSAASAAARSGPGSGWRRSVSVMLFLRDGAEEPGRAACASRARSLIADGHGLVGGLAGAVEDAGGGADVHQQG